MQYIQSKIISSNNDQHSHLQTPTKKIKKQPNADFNTADSICLTDQKSSLIDIDPKQLFQRFHDIIKIQETEQIYDDNTESETVYRKLNYSQNIKKSIKLDFSPGNSSMIKRNKIQNCQSQTQPIKAKHLFEPMEIVTSIKQKIMLQNEVQQIKPQQIRQFTPVKQQRKNFHYQMAAKKESPYRDLKN